MPIVINDCVKCAPHGVRAVSLDWIIDEDEDCRVFIRCDACLVSSGKYHNFLSALVEWNSDNPREPNW